MISWLKGHVDASNRLLKELEDMFRIHQLEDVQKEIKEATYALNRARQCLDEK